MTYVQYQASPITLTDGMKQDVQGDAVGNTKVTIATKVAQPSDAPVEAHTKPSDSRVSISANAQVLSGPGKLKGFWIISHTAGATVRFSDALTATTPYVSTAWTSVVANTNGDYIMLASEGMDMVTGCYCTITGSIEILPDAYLYA